MLAAQYVAMHRHIMEFSRRLTRHIDPVYSDIIGRLLSSLMRTSVAQYDALTRGHSGVTVGGRAYKRAWTFARGGSGSLEIGLRRNRRRRHLLTACAAPPGRCPTHPGALLREDVIPATGRTKAEIAQLLGISHQHLYDILRERKPVSPAVAVRLGKSNRRPDRAVSGHGYTMRSSCSAS